MSDLKVEDTINPNKEIIKPCRNLSEWSIYLRNEWKGRSHHQVPPSSPTSNFYFEHTYTPLPEQFPDLKDVELPVVREKGVRACIEELGELFNCTDYKFNYLHFWFLDVMTDCLWMCQDRFGFPKDKQTTVLGWIVFVIDIIRDPGKNLTRDEFLKVFKETACVAAELIGEGCHDFPVPLKMVTIGTPQQNSRKEEESVDTEETEDDSEQQTPETTLEQTSSLEYLSCIEFQIEEEVNLHIMKHEMCNSTDADTTDDTSSSVTETLTKESLTECSKPSTDFREFYKADVRTPPRFKSSAELNKNTKGDNKVDDIEKLTANGETFLIKIDGVSSKENLSKKKNSSGTDFILFEKKSWKSSEESECSDNTVTEQVKTDSKATLTINGKKSNATKLSEEQKILNDLKIYKIQEQRKKDMNDSKIGLEPWQTKDEVEDEAEKPQSEKVDEEYDIDEEILQLLRDQDIQDFKEKEFLSFGVLWAIIDFVYSYFSDYFQYSLIKMALTASPNIITQKLNDIWFVPKYLKEDLTASIKDLADKHKMIPIKVKAKKEKKEKKEKTKGEKGGKKEKKEKSPKLTKEEKLAKKREAALLKKQEKEEEAERLKQLMNKIFLFPLLDAVPDDAFFKTKFKNFTKSKFRKKGKGKN